MNIIISISKQNKKIIQKYSKCLRFHYLFKVTQSLIASQFLEDNGSQLTYHGLCELNATLKDGESAVLFRNNHFSVILKRRDVST